MNEKIRLLLEKKKFPQRALLSGRGNLIDLAIEISSNLQGIPRKKIESGVEPDTFIFRDDGQSFKIENKQSGENNSIRGITKLAHQKPLAPYRIIIVENIERVTNDASHAMLKLVEEPSSQVFFIFTTKNHHQLLQTILSRLTLINISEEENLAEFREEILIFFQKNNLLEKFKIIEELNKKSRENKTKINRSIFYDFLLEMINFARTNKQNKNHLDLLLKTHNGLDANISPRFCFERLAIKLN